MRFEPMMPKSGNRFPDNILRKQNSYSAGFRLLSRKA